MRKWQALIIHHSASAQTTKIAEVDKWHRARGFAGIGYHYFVEIATANLHGSMSSRGHLKAARSDTKIGAHCLGMNDKALGLCVAGNYETGAMSEAIYQDVLAAVCHICKTYHIPASQVFGHRDKYATACPGKNFPLTRLKADVIKRLSPAVPQKEPNADAIRVYVNGDERAVGKMIDGSVYVPARAVGEALGATVTWDAVSRTVRLERK
jgi:N-acetylmuramoyl-L-alanine amidase